MRAQSRACRDYLTCARAFSSKSRIVRSIEILGAHPVAAWRRVLQPEARGTSTGRTRAGSTTISKGTLMASRRMSTNSLNGRARLEAMLRVEANRQARHGSDQRDIGGDDVA